MSDTFTPHSIPQVIDKEIARLKLAGMDMRIDTLTKEQKKYLASWKWAPSRNAENAPERRSQSPNSLRPYWDAILSILHSDGVRCIRGVENSFYSTRMKRGRESFFLMSPTC